MKAGLGAMVAAMPFAALAGCHRVPDAAASLAQVRAQVEGQPVCAPVMSSTWPITFSAGVLEAPSFDALTAAGLFRRVAVPTPAGEPRRLRLQPLPAGRAALRLRRFTPAITTQPLLCYGRAHVLAVTTDRVGSAVAPGQRETPRLSYTFRVVDVPGWARRADVRAAFPFLDRAIGPVLRSRDVAFLEDGRWRLPHAPDENSVAALDGRGFFDCPVPDARPDSPCR